MNNDDYTTDVAHDRAQMTQAERLIESLREERTTRINLACQQCGHTMPTDRRAPGVEYCSPTCDHIARFRGVPGDIAYAPRNDEERSLHRREQRQRRKGRTS